MTSYRQQTTILRTGVLALEQLFGYFSILVTKPRSINNKWWKVYYILETLIKNDCHMRSFWIFFKLILRQGLTWNLWLTKQVFLVLLIKVLWKIPIFCKKNPSIFDDKKQIFLHGKNRSNSDHAFLVSIVCIREIVGTVCIKNLSNLVGFKYSCQYDVMTVPPKNLDHIKSGQK